jgi:hypothetical protein
MVPIGFVHDAQDHVILDPDSQVQASVRLFFQTFQRTGSCLAVVKSFMRRNSCSAAIAERRAQGRAGLGRVAALPCTADHPQPTLCRCLRFGRTKQRHLPNGKVCSRLVPSEEWILLRDVHPGYITW